MQSVQRLGTSVVGVAALFLAAACAGGHTSSIRTSQGLGAAPPVTAAGGIAPAGGSNPSLVQGTPALQPNTLGSPQAALPQQAPAIAYPWYAPAQSQTGLTVPGFGQAQATADSAVLNIFLGAQVVNGPMVTPGSGPIQPPQLTPVADADVQAVVDAVKGQGVSDSDIRIDRSAGTATIAVTVHHLGALSTIEQAATKAAEARNLNPSSSVTYSVSDCASLEQAALKAAISDANTRVSGLAHALNIGVGAIAGAGYTVYPAFGANACESGGVVPLTGAVPGGSGTAGQAPEVQLSVSVTVTFSIK